MDIVSKSDPMVVVFDESRPGVVELGRTEMIKYVSRELHYTQLISSLTIIHSFVILLIPFSLHFSFR